MNGKSNSGIKRNNNINLDIFKENKNISLNKIKSLTKNPSKKPKAFFINNQNHIESINIINNNINYKNIILQNLPSTQNKQYTISGKDSSRNKKTVKIEKNILFNNNNINNNFQTIVNKKPKSLNKNGTLRLMINSLEDENYNINDNELKYKLKLYEKNNIINKLKDELEYYKSYYHNMNQNNTKKVIIPNFNTINAIHNDKLGYTIEEKNKIIKTEDMRNKIKNIFNIGKNNTKFFNKGNINNLHINLENENETINNSRIKKEGIYTIQNKSGNKKRNKLIISNDKLKLNIKSENNSSDTTSNVFYRSNSNTIKRKTGFNELNIDNDKYNSIEVNRNNASYMNYIRNKKEFISSLNRNIILRGIYENENDDIKFNYIEKFESLKKRMNDLMTNLFDLLKNKFN